VRALFSNIPRNIPVGGLITKNDDDKYFGIWIMPDNQGHGMLETFLRYLVPDHQSALWSHAERSTADALDHGGTYRRSHSDKAQIHTWLAWVDPPGERFGTALLKKILDASAPSAALFVRWFKELYQL
jgi:hypothetical protein